MKIVDASALLAILLREPEWKEIADLVSITNAASPESLPMEIGNSLSSLIRRGLLSSEQAAGVWSAYKQVPVRLLSIPYNLALEIAFSNQIYAYDAYVISTAKQHKAVLVTLDRQMGRIARKYNVRVEGV